MILTIDQVYFYSSGNFTERIKLEYNAKIIPF